jgi:hypothetical protein
MMVAELQRIQELILVIDPAPCDLVLYFVFDRPVNGPGLQGQEEVVQDEQDQAL